MKKQVRQLRLFKETLRHLEVRSLSAAVGGTINQTSVACVQATGCDCNSQDLGCGLPASACQGTCSCNTQAVTCLTCTCNSCLACY